MRGIYADVAQPGKSTRRIQMESCSLYGAVAQIRSDAGVFTGPDEWIPLHHVVRVWVEAEATEKVEKAA
jgi:hypothetical protein